MVTNLAILCMLGVTGTTVFASLPITREKKALLELKFNVSDLPNPPSREDLKAALKQAAGYLDNASSKLGDPGTNVTMQSSLKRDVAPLVPLAKKAADVPVADEDEGIPVVRRKASSLAAAGRGRIDIRVSWKKKKRAAVEKSLN